MKSYSRIEFLDEIIPLSLAFRSLWRHEIAADWVETKTYLRSLRADEDALNHFAAAFSPDLSAARVAATLAYLDQYDVLREKFSTFTEFSFGAALTLGTDRLQRAECRRLHAVLCHLDEFVANALFGSEAEWQALASRARQELEHLKSEIHLLHPRLKSLSSGERRLRVA